LKMGLLTRGPLTLMGEKRSGAEATAKANNTKSSLKTDQARNPSLGTKRSRRGGGGEEIKGDSPKRKAKREGTADD